MKDFAAVPLSTMDQTPHRHILKNGKKSPAGATITSRSPAQTHMYFKLKNRRRRRLKKKPWGKGITNRLQEQAAPTAFLSCFVFK